MPSVFRGIVAMVFACATANAEQKYPAFGLMCQSLHGKGTLVVVIKPGEVYEVDIDCRGST
ncbi:MAG: hypothetical protein ACRCV9_03080 [Burkholderiaceae bacterium]